MKGELLAYNQQLVSLTKARLNAERTRLLAIEKSGALKDPVTRLNEKRRELLYLSEKINDLTQAHLDSQKLRFSALAGKLNALSPLGVISRGYAIVNKGDKVVTKAKDFNIGDVLSIKLADGTVNASVTGICEE